MRLDDINEGLKDAKDNPCWRGYHPVGTKEKDGRTVPNCVPESANEISEMDSQGYTGSRDRKSMSKYGSRDDYELGQPETTLGPDSIAKPADVVKHGVSALHKALDSALSKQPKLSPQQVQRNKERWAQRQAEREQGVAEGTEEKDPIWNKGTPMPKDYTCPCGIHVHPSIRNPKAIHDPGCPYAKKQGVAEGLSFNDKRGKWEWDDGTRVSPDELTPAQKQRVQQWKAANPGKQPSRASVPDTREPARGFGGRVFDEGVAEGSGNIGPAIKSLYQKIYNAGDDEIEYFYNDSPIFAQYWDEYEGDLDSIIAEVDPKELQIMHDELESYVQQANLAEVNSTMTANKKSALSQAVAEAGWGRRYTSYHDELSSRDRDEQNYMDQSKRAFKRAEMQHELGHEDDPNFERNLRQQQMAADRGPWYIRIDGKIYKQKGVAKSFDWKRGANNYALAMIKNNPSLQGKIMLSKSAEDK